MSVSFLSIAAATIVAVGNPTLATVDTGALQGTMAAKDVRSFLGIPYAAPPVGDLRWRAPRRATAWQGVRQATSSGASCMQPGAPRTLPQPGPVIPQVTSLNEDRLTLNVWAPAAAAKKKLPVMVWFHGGGFYMGLGGWPSYNGATLAREGVVVVTVNYRLGAFGFFAHPELTRKAKGERCSAQVPHL